MNELQLINYPLTKIEQKILAEKLMQPLFDGEINPVEFYSKVKGLLESLKEVEKNKQVKEVVVREIEKEGGKYTSWCGVQLSVKEVGVKYDFTDCNDPVYLELQMEREKLDTKIKEREAFLKTVPDKFMFIDENTGECFYLHPAVRTASDSVVTTFKKQ